MSDTIPQEPSNSQDLSNESSNKRVFIYALRHPETKEIRYVGKSNDPQRRLKDHLREKGETRKVRWLASLKRQKLLPELLILEEVEESQWEVAEQKWITHHRLLGCDLTNLTDGGDGVHNPGPEARERLSASRKQLFADPEFKTKMMEVTGDPERCAKISQALSGKEHSPEHIAKLPQNKPGKKLTGEERQRISEGLRKRYAQDRANGIKRRRTKPMSEQERRNRSLASTGRKHPNRRKWTEEENLRRSLTQKGRAQSQSHRQAIREGQKRRWQQRKQEKNNGITFLELWTQESDDPAV